MRLLETLALLILAAAVFSFVNTYFLRLPSTIGLLLSGLAASAVILAVNWFFPSLGITSDARQLIGEIDFSRFLFRGVLSFLLFAGALHLDFEETRREKVPIFVLASVGVALSTAVVGVASYAILRVFGGSVPLAYCLVFGALISPTDPVAVLGIVKSLHAPRTLQIRIAGESLFNDGFAVVAFSVLLTLAAAGHQDASGLFSAAALLFAREVIGGIALGLAAGLVTYQAMKRINEPNVEVLLSLGLVIAVSLSAERFHASAPLACVVAGLFIGNRGRRFAMERATREALDQVWSFIDVLLNAALFLLLGLEALFLLPQANQVFSLLLLIPLMLLARWISVGAGIVLLRGRHAFGPGALSILTWGGLRGGISVAMALSLPMFPGRSEILVATYGIVVFSIVVQGLTVAPLARWLLRARAEAT